MAAGSHHLWASGPEVRSLRWEPLFEAVRPLPFPFPRRFPSDMIQPWDEQPRQNVSRNGFRC